MYWVEEAGGGRKYRAQRQQWKQLRDSQDVEWVSH